MENEIIQNNSKNSSIELSLTEEALLQNLFEAKKLSTEQINQLKIMQKELKGQLTSLICKLGFIKEEELTKFIAQYEGIELADIEEMIIPENLIRMVPREILEQYQILPIAKSGNTITIATSDPQNIDAMQDVLLATRCRVKVALATHSSITKLLSNHFGKEWTPPTIPDYDLEEKIAFGDIGPIYKAKQVLMNRQVTIKFLSHELTLSPEIPKIFLQTAQLVAKLNHINIVAGIDAGEKEGKFYFIMEYIDGPSLAQKMKQGSLKAEESLQYFLQIAAALKHLNKHQIAHGCISPIHLLVGEEDQIKLLGFGSFLKKAAEKPGFLSSSLEYISPEQIPDAFHFDIRSDIYSLGILFFQMWTGVLPFEGEEEEIKEGHLKKIPPPLKEITKSPEIDKISFIVSKMLEKDPQKRYQTPKELIQDIELISIQKLRDFPIPKTQKWNWPSLKEIQNSASEVLSSSSLFEKRDSEKNEKPLLLSEMKRPSQTKSLKKTPSFLLKQGFKAFVSLLLLIIIVLVIQSNKQPSLEDYISNLKNKNWSIRKEAAINIGKLGFKAQNAIPVLLVLMQHEDPDVRLLAIDTIGKIGPIAQTAIPDFISTLKTEKNKEVSIRILEIFIEIEARSPEVESVLTQMAQAHHSRKVRETAKSTLAQLQSTSKTDLERPLNSSAFKKGFFIEQHFQKYFPHSKPLTALEDCNIKIKRNPNNVYQYLERAKIKTFLKDYIGARKDFELLENKSKIPPRIKAQIQFWKGICYFKAGNVKEAEVVLNRVIEQIEKMEESVKKALPKEIEYSQLFLIRGNLRYLLGNKKKTIQDFKRFLMLTKTINSPQIQKQRDQIIEKFSELTSKN